MNHAASTPTDEALAVVERLFESAFGSRTVPTKSDTSGSPAASDIAPAAIAPVDLPPLASAVLPKA